MEGVGIGLIADIGYGIEGHVDREVNSFLTNGDFCFIKNDAKTQVSRHLANQPVSHSHMSLRLSGDALG